MEREKLPCGHDKFVTCDCCDICGLCEDCKEAFRKAGEDGARLRELFEEKMKANRK